MSILNRTDMNWVCPYCETENTDSLESLDYEPAMCKKCNKLGEVYFDVQPFNITVKGIDD